MIFFMFQKPYHIAHHIGHQSLLCRLHRCYGNIAYAKFLPWYRLKSARKVAASILQICARAARRMAGIISSSTSSSYNNMTADDALSTVNSYVDDKRRFRDPKGKRSARKWWTPLVSQCLITI